MCVCIVDPVYQLLRKYDDLRSQTRCATFPEEVLSLKRTATMHASITEPLER